MKYKQMLHILLSVFFYGTMLVLTLIAVNVHNARLPHVTASRLGSQEFKTEVTLEGGYTREVKRLVIGVPKELVDTDSVFVLTNREKNGMTYYYCRKVKVTYSLENEKYYAVENGISSMDTVILSGYEELTDGCEVFWVREDGR